jgi:hypothetical protein
VDWQEFGREEGVMAKIIRRTWTTQGPTGKKVRHVAYGYTLMVNGRQERKSSSAWLTEAAALEALTARQKETGAGIIERVERTLGELAEEYWPTKADQGKRSVVSDRRILKGRVLPALGDGLPVRTLTCAMIAQYEKARMATTAKGRERKVSAYTVANELAVLRHMLRLARRWGYVDRVSEIVEHPARAGHLLPDLAIVITVLDLEMRGTRRWSISEIPVKPTE